MLLGSHDKLSVSCIGHLMWFLYCLTLLNNVITMSVTKWNHLLLLYSIININSVYGLFIMTFSIHCLYLNLLWQYQIASLCVVSGLIINYVYMDILVPHKDLTFTLSLNRSRNRTQRKSFNCCTTYKTKLIIKSNSDCWISSSVKNQSFNFISIQSLNLFTRIGDVQEMCDCGLTKWKVKQLNFC